jgi:hypothetical protein
MLDRTVVMGFSLKDLTFAPANLSFGACGFTLCDTNVVSDDNEGSRSFAASQSSSANYDLSDLTNRNSQGLD